jgi:hypothetical protein
MTRDLEICYRRDLVKGSEVDTIGMIARADGRAGSALIIVLAVIVGPVGPPVLACLADVKRIRASFRAESGVESG